MSAAESEQGPNDVLILVFGILGIVLCQLFAPVAWWMGAREDRRCEALGRRPSQLAVVGKILGIVGCVIFVVGLAFLLLGGFAVLVGSASSG